MPVKRHSMVETLRHKSIVGGRSDCRTVGRGAGCLVSGVYSIEERGSMLVLTGIWNFHTFTLLALGGPGAHSRLLRTSAYCTPAVTTTQNQSPSVSSSRP